MFLLLLFVPFVLHLLSVATIILMLLLFLLFWIIIVFLLPMVFLFLLFLLLFLTDVWGCNCSRFCCCWTFLIFFPTEFFSGCLWCMSISFDSFLCIKLQIYFPLLFCLFISLIQIIYSIDTIVCMYKSCILFSSIFLSNSPVNWSIKTFIQEPSIFLLDFLHLLNITIQIIHTISSNSNSSRYTVLFLVVSAAIAIIIILFLLLLLVPFVQYLLNVATIILVLLMFLFFWIILVFLLPLVFLFLLFLLLFLTDVLRM